MIGLHREIAMIINEKFQIGYTFNVKNLKQIMNVDRNDSSKTQLMRIILDSLVKSGFLKIDPSYRTNRYKKIKHIDVNNDPRIQSLYIINQG